MKLNKKIETEILKTYNAYWVAYLKGNMHVMSSFMDKNIQVIGSGQGEVFKNKKETVKYYKATANQISGKSEMRNRKITLASIANNILVTEIFDFFVFMDAKWTFYGEARLSTLFAKNDDKWSIIQQHGSLPDARTGGGEQLNTDKIKEENLRLKDAVKRRTIELEGKNRELEIEAALERVRTVAMGMTKPDDLLDICKQLFKELQLLGFSDLRNTLVNTYNDKTKYFINYDFSDDSGGNISQIPYSGNTVIEKFIKDIRKKNDAFSEIKVSGKELEDWKAFRKANGEIDDPLLDSIKALYYYNYSKGEAGIGISTLSSISTEKQNVLKRFRNIFDLAYKRYIDIALAETQAREAQIELALERVRAKTMAMQKSDELGDASHLLVLQVKALGIDTWGCAFNIFDEGQNSSTEWFSNNEGSFSTYKTPREGIFLRYYEAVRKGETLHIEELKGKACQKHYEYLCTLPVVGNNLIKLKESGIPFPSSQIDHVAYFKFGYLLFITFKPVPEAYEIFKRFAKVFEQTYTRFLDLQKAEAQAREAQIEASLERVRARTMAMHNSEELLSTANLLYNEFRNLGITHYFTCGFVIVDEENSVQHVWVTDMDGEIFESFKLPLTGDSVLQLRYEKWKQKVPVFYQKVGGEELKRHLAFVIPYFGSEEAEDMVANQFPDPTFFYMSNFSNGYLHLVGAAKLTDEEEILLARFMKVFEQTYTRFLDLQKAEAQAKEAKIEVALEKVRSRSLAMHISEELLDVITVVSEQLRELNFRFSHVSFANSDFDKNYRFWVSAKGMTNPMYVSVPHVDIPMFNHLRKAQQKGLKFFTDILTKQENKQWHKHLLKYSSDNLFSEKENEYIMSRGMARSIAIHPNITLILANLASIPYSEEDNKIIARFGQVFDQTYTRFLDLKKAEAQAREAQIEAALERVRSRSMAMYNSNELLEAGSLLYQELTKLDITSLTSGYVLMDEAEKIGWNYLSDPVDGKIINQPLEIPHQETEVMRSLTNSWKKQEPFWVRELDEQDTIKHQTFIAERTNNFHLSPKELIALTPERLVLQTFNFKQGYLLIVGAERLSDDQVEMMLRFTKVFQMTYRRFLDLKKAEAQAHEAKIEASLERVRSRTMAMQNSDELQDVAMLLFQQVEALGVPLFACGFNIWDADKKEATAWMGSINGLQPPFKTDSSKDIYLLIYEAAQRGESLFVKEQGGKELEAHYAFLTTIPEVKKMAEAGLTFPTFQIIHCAFFSQGYLMFITYKPVPDAYEIFKRFAKVFEQTYIRFNDLKLAEYQVEQAKIDLIKLQTEKKRAEDALTHLQAAQEQLIQQEKLASLGQLTAGIAHEIKNPLNFVNNFSDLSMELIDEVFEELDKANNQENTEEIRDLLNVVKSNLEKIYQHGTRADGIVKSMLQHSRGGTGKMELTDFNALIKEFVNLSFHGMRASKNPINVSLKFELDEKLGLVNLISEDFSRVVLNLCNNAFDAMREKIKTEKNYLAVLTLKTARLDNDIMLTVTDNGPGIKNDIKDKILQPFFTTKKGTEGTGLGLSITNDIIKSHGGVLQIETKENEGTEFKIILHNNN